MGGDSPPPAKPSRVDLIRRIYAAFQVGDFSVLQQAASRDVVLHMPGDNIVSGTHRGVGAVLAVIAEAGQRMVPGSFRPLEIEQDGDEIRATIEVTMRSMRGETNTTRIVQRYGFDEDGFVTEVRVEPEDLEAFDRLLQD